ncbi:MAG: GxGYxYP domain-containing protein [Armatimonadota bacterium]
MTPNIIKGSMNTTNYVEKEIFHIDMMEAKWDIRFTMTVLQGIVNRENPCLIISQDSEWHRNPNYEIWIEDLKDREHTITEITIEEAIERFKKRIKGAVLYDTNPNYPRSMHKINPITLYCAIENYIPLTKEQNEIFKLPVASDLTGKYDKPMEAYTWAYTELWQKASKERVAHLWPGHILVRDYLVANKIMPLWIDNEMVHDKLMEESLLHKFIQEAENHAILMGCWDIFKVPPAGRYSEAFLQRLSSIYAKTLIPTSGCYNTSLHSKQGYKKPVGIKPRETPKFDKNKIYIVFTISDGDNLQYLQQTFVNQQWWLNEGRGKVPIAWSLNPAAIDMIPHVVEYLQKTATPMDELMCSTAGIGLVTPSLYGKEKRGQNSTELFREFMKISNDGMKALGMSSIQLGDTSETRWSWADFDLCAQNMPEVKIILGDYGEKDVFVLPDNHTYKVSNDVLVMRTVGTIGMAPDITEDIPADDFRAKQIVEQIKSFVTDERPLFMHVPLVNWYITPTAIVKATELLGNEYMPILPSEAVALYHEAQNMGSK